MSATDKLLDEGNLLITKIEVEFDRGKEFVRLHFYIRGEWAGLLSVGKEDWVGVCSRLKFFGTSISFRNLVIPKDSTVLPDPDEYTSSADLT